MIITETYQKSLEFVLSNDVASNQLSFSVSYKSATENCSGFTSLYYSFKSGQGISNNTAAVTILPAPSRNTNTETNWNELMFASIKNRDSAASEVTIRYNSNGTTTDIYTVILDSESTLFYEHEEGFYVLDKFGSVNPIIDTDDMKYLIATGTDSYVGSSAKITSYYDGLTVAVKFQNANTGASTLNINGLGAKSIKNFGNSDLSGSPNSDIKSGQVQYLTYDITNDWWQLPTVTNNIQNDI